MGVACDTQAHTNTAADGYSSKISAATPMDSPSVGLG